MTRNNCVNSCASRAAPSVGSNAFQRGVNGGSPGGGNVLIRPTHVTPSAFSHQQGGVPGDCGISSIYHMVLNWLRLRMITESITEQLEVNKMINKEGERTRLFLEIRVIINCRMDEEKQPSLFNK